MSDFDVFLSHNSSDMPAVRAVSQKLAEYGLKSWLDEEQLRPGMPWQDLLEQGIENSASVALCVSADGRGPWEGKAMQAALRLAVKGGLPVIPVLLPGAPEEPELPLFLSNRIWVDLSRGLDEEGIRRLVWGITGNKPEPLTSRDGSAQETATPVARSEGEPAEHRDFGETRTLRVPDIAWIEVPAGEFIYGDGKERTARHLDTFWIARYPITNLQYETFVEDGGYRQARWWLDLEKPEPDKPRWPRANRPRTDVDWYEAVAFTRWLTVRLGLPEGTLRLPTEYEWEKAARGEKGLIYPWGEKYKSGFANIDETARKDGPWHLEQTTAVGLYPQGRSPYGVEDLSGTVWEWCLNKYDQSDTVAADTSGDSRALRGGSWLGSSGLARAGYRDGDQPDFRDDGWGFRVLSSVPIPDH